jgi:YVTN family beta-propeller protein
MLRLLATVLLIAGCRVDLMEAGTEPRKEEFYFPVGLEKDPDQPFLYVSNGNSDLKYGGGTVQLVDIKRFRAAVDRFRSAKNDCGAGTDCETCVEDPLDPNVTNCSEEPFILENVTVKLGNFAGTIKIQKTGALTRRLFVAVRGDPSVTWINVDLNQPINSGGNSRGTFVCVDDPSALPAEPENPPGCDPSFQVQTYPCVGKPTCTTGLATIPPEPFAMALDEGKLASGQPYQRLVVSHLASGQITVVDVQAAPYVRDVSGPLFAADAAGRRGAFAIAPQRPGDPSAPWYLTSNLQPTIATFRIADVHVVVPSIAFSLGGQFATNNDLRDIIFEEGGNRAFVSVNAPPSLVVLDTRTNPNGTTPGAAVNQVVDVVNICQIPSHMEVRYVQTPAGRRPRLYVACFLSNQIMVVDPDAPTVVDTILVGRQPNEIAFDEDPVRPVAWVSQFGEHSIGMIDLQRGSPTENRLIARIGLPTLPRVQ